MSYLPSGPLTSQSTINVYKWNHRDDFVTIGFLWNFQNFISVVWDFCARIYAAYLLTLKNYNCLAFIWDFQNFTRVVWVFCARMSAAYILTFKLYVIISVFIYRITQWHVNNEFIWNSLSKMQNKINWYMISTINGFCKI